jgi:hypothetical protein
MNPNGTWNTCPDCGKKWKDKKPTPGLIHRTTLCDDCKAEVANGIKLKEGEAERMLRWMAIHCVETLQLKNEDPDRRTRTIKIVVHDKDQKALLEIIKDGRTLFDALARCVRDGMLQIPLP